MQCSAIRLCEQTFSFSTRSYYHGAASVFKCSCYIITWHTPGAPVFEKMAPVVCGEDKCPHHIQQVPFFLILPLPSKHPESSSADISAN